MAMHFDIEVAGRTLAIDMGRVARQADGSAVVRYGDTVVLVTAVASKQADETRDWLPLFVEYREKTYAAGKIPGGFFKREGRPREKEILSARMIDRPIRPLFPQHLRREIQIVCLVLSADQENDADILGVIGASAALAASTIPFTDPIGAVRMGLIDGRYIINPTFTQVEGSALNLVVVGSEESVIMLEGSAREVPEEALLRAVEIAHEEIRRIIQLQREFVDSIAPVKWEVPPLEIDPELARKVRELAWDGIHQANALTTKEQRQGTIDALLESVLASLADQYPDQERIIGSIFLELEQEDVRGKILREERRTDGRGLTDIRPISCEVGVLPRTHGSALFTRGQTQSLAVTTLGTASDEQVVDDLEGETSKSYMLHYNFPPFSVGEVRPFRGPSRREVGHGALAERAIESVIPKEEAFPYTIRIVSDILESNGSSSMATVCGAALSLMDAGVPVKALVSGIAMGMIKEGDRRLILSDILGVEDHLGDMDLKVAGTREGVTALQLDLKVPGLETETMRRALEQAKAGRLHVLDVMEQTIAKPRPELSPYAPRIIMLTISKDKIGDLIGPGGKMIRKIIELTNTKIEVEDDGTVVIASVDQEAGERALQMVREVTEEAEVGKVYTGKVKKITSFGAFVEILPGQDGLVHISQLAHHRVAKVEDVLKEGDEVVVKVIGIDENGKVKLSRKAVLDRGKEDRSGKGGER